MAQGERAAALLPIDRDALLGPHSLRQLVRIYTALGEPTAALDRLERLLRVSHMLSPGWLGIDPNFDPLQNLARLQRLVSEKAA